MTRFATIALAALVIAGCRHGPQPDAASDTPPMPTTQAWQLAPPKTYPAECALPRWDLGQRVVRVEGSLTTITEARRRSLVPHGEPNRGDRAASDDVWTLSGPVTDPELRALGAFCEQHRCRVEVIIDTDAYSDRLYAVYCDRAPMPR